MDGHKHLHYQSLHPQHIKTHSQVLRASRICLLDKDFKTHISRVEECFLILK